ncbi:PP2C family protein-serine/threonine phosphatase [Streptomyces nodosus]|uniref:PP2C family protein-serine/threonine phosphatase n=1 Tax=Streptomyces nodosus TaxID=40318 RepID=UPI003F51A145
MGQHGGAWWPGKPHGQDQEMSGPGGAPVRKGPERSEKLHRGSCDSSYDGTGARISGAQGLYGDGRPGGRGRSPGRVRHPEPDHDRPGDRLPGGHVPGPEAGTADGASPGGRTPSRRFSLAQGFVRALPVLLIVAGIFYDFFSPPANTAGPLFTAAALVAAPLYSLRGTVLTGTAAVGSVVGIHFVIGRLQQTEEITEAVTVFTAAVLSVLINVLVRRNIARLASAREIAGAAQRAVLPEPAARIDGLDIAARYEAAQADAFIGGDLYAVQECAQGVRLLVGDVRGKGMGAVAAVAVVVGAFREAVEHESRPEAVTRRLERALMRERTLRGGLEEAEGFVTAVIAEIAHCGVVRIVNRGHPAPLLLLPDGTLRALETREPALPLGLGELGDGPGRAEEWDFPPGAMLLLYTDGLSEARDEHGEFYDPAVRLAGRVFAGPGALLATVTAEVAQHTGGRAVDDMALLAVRRRAVP